MTLRIIEPFAITAANVDNGTTNVALETAWTAGTYTLGTVRRVNERLFEVSAASTTQDPGLATSTEWFDAGPANRYAAFDIQLGADKYRVIDTLTTRATPIIYRLTGLPRLSAMAFFGLACTQIKIYATLSIAGDEADVTYDIPSVTQYQASFWRWSFLPQSFERTYANFDLDIAAGSTIDITITNTGGISEVNTVAMGIAAYFGVVEVTSKRSLRSRSVKKTEGTLTSLLRRAPASRVGYMVHLDEYIAGPFWRAIDDLDGVAAVFSGPTENQELLAYGFVTSCQTVSDVRGISKVQLEVETL